MCISEPWKISLCAIMMIITLNRAGLSAAPLNKYDITDLGTLGGASQAHAINDRGQVVGEAQAIEPKTGTEAEEHAFLWTGGRMLDLGSLPQSESEVHTSKAFALNDWGEVVGGSGSYEPIGPDMGVFVSASPFIYAQGRMRLLGKEIDNMVPLGEAFGINNHDQIIGTDGNGAFLWHHGKRISLGTLLKQPSEIRITAQESSAAAINDKGQIVGYAAAGPTGEETHPFLWQSGRMTDLGTPSGTTDGSASAINRRGDVAGTASGQAPGNVAWWWRLGKIHVLPILDGTLICAVHSMNDSLQIVGHCDQDAVLWEDHRPHNLNTLLVSPNGWHLTEATGINNHGQIVGFGTHNGKQRAFLLTPLKISALTTHGLGDWGADCPQAPFAVARDICHNLALYPKAKIFTVRWHSMAAEHIDQFVCVYDVRRATLTTTYSEQGQNTQIVSHLYHVTKAVLRRAAQEPTMATRRGLDFASPFGSFIRYGAEQHP